MATKPRIVASAVSITGMIRILPACIAASLVRIPLPRSSSVNSINRIPFLITIPASPTIPTITMISGISHTRNRKTKKHTDDLKKYFTDYNKWFADELNCKTRIRKIIPNAMINAVRKIYCVSASCSLCPLSLMVTSAGFVFV